jgi:hypothetical protein
MNQNSLDAGDHSLEAALAWVETTASAVERARHAHQKAVIDARDKGASIRELAQRAGYSPSRVYELVRRSRAASPAAELDKGLGAPVDDVVVVAGGPHGAYGIYRRFSVYACQPRRFFRPTARYVGFYFDKRIYPEFGAILHIAPSVRFDDDSLAELRESNGNFDTRIADIALALRDEGLRDSATENQIVLLSQVGEERTLTLQQPIRHHESAAWTRSQRYISSAALLSDITSTLELGRLS